MPHLSLADTMLATSTQLEVLDLRHFSAPSLRPLLEEEAARWGRRLIWDYSRSIELLLEYVNSRSLTGYVALRQGRVAGYAFGVCEAAKAVMGDVYAFGESEQLRNPVCELLLEHLIETLQATPGVHRIESQLLLFPEGALHTPFVSQGFRPFPRLFMVRRLEVTEAWNAVSLPAAYRIDRWQPESYLFAAALIQQAYQGHMDSEINDQYRTLHGAQRFLHNIVHFPGCGLFDPANSWLLHDAETGVLEGMALCSRVRGDAAHITQLCVRPGLRGQGLGSSLLQHCLQRLAQAGIRSVSLTVTESNTRAEHLYRQMGFEVLHRFEAWVWENGSARG